MKLSFQARIVSTILILILVSIFIDQFKFSKKPELVEIVKETDLPFCTIMPPAFVSEEANAALKQQNIWDKNIEMIGETSLFWDYGQTLRIYFLDGYPEIQDSVLKIANKWFKLTGLKYKHVTSKYDAAEIKVSFDCAGYNSLIGKQSLKAEKYKATMCLQGLNKVNDPALFARTVLHEFGHVMGLYHESCNPSAKIPWDTTALYHYYDSVYKLKSDFVDKWVLAQYSGSDFSHSNYDSLSIMMYQIPKSVTKGGYSVKWPDRLSTMDSSNIMREYNAENLLRRKKIKPFK